ncbi:plasmid replication protein RepC [Rhizobium leguminosarum]|uniref:plasmid replication protein RepC n=1 Tax=Rhizobium leguminosarum TaxID=384 RepID=UPI00143F91B6|nr:plasmid replication protein RepC [Rhizobium leguminosarum]NKL21163.1 replication initiation protein RepC [Rhizobium leguminosarum bv. viciae]NKL56870.1 replication initiation protein RepC [Rhizobium leguminosarum bv. viciae]
MQTHDVTTPFGRRPMTLAMLATQFKTAEIDPERSVDKWKLFRSLCEARERIGVSDRALAVLNALLSFYPKPELSEEHGLVVFPSNAQLSLRTHGMAPTTLRRHLAALVDAGLIIRNDSPNGKRYARKGKGGAIEQAFGFSVAPLVARAGDIAALAAEAEAERQELRVVRERLSLCRRDVSKLIETAIEEGAPGDWAAVFESYHALCRGIPRHPAVADIAPILDELELLREEIVNRLEILVNVRNMTANDRHIGCHIQNSNPESISDLEPALEKKQGAMAEEEQQQRPMPPKGFPLGMVLQACPQIADYGPGGSVSSWRDLMTAAVVVRSMLGVSRSAYEEACGILGPENAATIVACILERGGHINSAGGYLRDLTRRADRGEFSLGPMLMALIRANGASALRAG